MTGVGPNPTLARTRQKRRRAAFTLIELLVIIAILSVLLSLLTPVLQLGRELARRSVCQSNLRSIGVATTSYASSYRGKLMPMYHTDPRYYTPQYWPMSWKVSFWDTQGRQYGLNANVMQCPTCPRWYKPLFMPPSNIETSPGGLWGPVYFGSYHYTGNPEHGYGNPVAYWDDFSSVAKTNFSPGTSILASDVIALPHDYWGYPQHSFMANHNTGRVTGGVWTYSADRSALEGSNILRLGGDVRWKPSHEFPDVLSNDDGDRGTSRAASYIISRETNNAGAVW
jgi:type II secretory pathway pseudopilin PulG